MQEDDRTSSYNSRADNRHQAESGPLLLSVTKASKLLDVGRTTLFGLIREGQIPSVKLGKTTKVALADLHVFVDRLRRGSPVVEPRSVRTIGLTEVADLLGFPLAKATRAVNQRGFPATVFKVDGLRGWSEADVLSWRSAQSNIERTSPEGTEEKAGRHGEH